MRPGDTASRADLAHHLAGDNGVAFFHIHRLKVREQRKQPQAVVDHYGVAREVQVGRHRDAPGIWRLNGRPSQTRKVGAAVRTAWLAVEDAAGPKRAVRG